MLNNLTLVNCSLTAPQSQMIINNERLKTYGDSLLSILFLTDVYLNRTNQNSEKDLDSKRKIVNSKEHMQLINLRHEIYKYMMVEPQSQQPIAINY